MILVNFERTDLMKRKVMSIFKFINKFKEIITIVVTDFQLSESKANDE